MNKHIEKFILSDRAVERAYGRLLATGVEEKLTAWMLDEQARRDGLQTLISAYCNHVSNTVAKLLYAGFEPVGYNELADHLTDAINGGIKECLQRYSEPDDE